MKLRFDENLSFKLGARMQDAFPEPQHVRDLGLEQANDLEIWQCTKRENFVIVDKDADFHDMSVILGHPPYVVWIRIGNVRVNNVEKIIRLHQTVIEESVREGKHGIIELD